MTMNEKGQSDSPTEILPENHIASQVWSSGGENYERISRQIADALEHCVDRLAPQPGERILDVATGTGWTARRIAEHGASVTGVDFGEEVIAAARRIDATGSIDFQVGDAESLPFEDGSFDAVTSTFGVMFCGNPERAAKELARVCRPGGRIALATWAPELGVADFFKVIKKYQPTPPVPKPSPFDWGYPRRLDNLFGGSFEMKTETAISYYHDPDAKSAWKAFSIGYGPVVSTLAKLDEARASQFEVDFIEYHEQFKTSLGILVERPYVIAVGTRRD